MRRFQPLRMLRIPSSRSSRGYLLLPCRLIFAAESLVQYRDFPTHCEPSTEHMHRRTLLRIRFNRCFTGSATKISSLNQNVTSNRLTNASLYFAQFLILNAVRASVLTISSVGEWFLIVLTNLTTLNTEPYFFTFTDKVWL